MNNSVAIDDPALDAYAITRLEAVSRTRTHHKRKQHRKSADIEARAFSVCLNI